MLQWQLIQSLGEDIFDAFVADTVKVQRPDTGVSRRTAPYYLASPIMPWVARMMIQNRITE